MRTCGECKSCDHHPFQPQLYYCYKHDMMVFKNTPADNCEDYRHQPTPYDSVHNPNANSREAIKKFEESKKEMYRDL